MTTLAPLIDHTLLAADATELDILTLCAEADTHKFAAVCVLPSRVALAARELEGTSVKVCTVIGFPLGANTSQTKLHEAREAVRLGADELDVVVNIGDVKDGRWAAVEAEIQALRDELPEHTLKIIFETGLLCEDEKILLARLCSRVGVDFVKTSTGSTHGGATVADVILLRANVSPLVGVKASGGIKTLENALALVEAGATRLGTSHGLALVKATQASAAPADY